MSARHYWANNNVEMSLLSVRMVYVSVNKFQSYQDISSLSWLTSSKQKGHNTVPSESRTCGSSDIALGYI